MKKILIIIVCVFILCGCTTKPNEETTNLTALETAELYFQYWNEKDVEKLNSLQIKRDYDFAYNLDIDEVKIISAELISNPTWVDEWYENPVEITEVQVIYNLSYKDGIVTGPENDGENQLNIYLVKEVEDGPWKIAMFG